MSLTVFAEEAGLTLAQLELVKTQICPGASDDELKLFLYTAKRAGVDPLLKQIYSVRRGGKMVIQMGIDGFRAVAAQQNDYLPGEETFEYDSDGNLISATVSVYKILANGEKHKFSKAAYWTEYAQYQKDKYSGKMTLSQFWKQFPRVMLAKCAEAAVLRKGWPNVFSKIYTPEEMPKAEKEQENEILIEEVNKLEPEEAISFTLPSYLPEEAVEEYFSYLADFLNRPISYLKARANENPEKFLETCKKWFYLEKTAV